MPPSTREKLAIGISSAVLATGLITAFQPPSHDAHERHRQQTQKDVGDLSDAQEEQNRRYREEGDTHGESENLRALTPGEYRPAEPRMRIRVAP